MENTNEDIHEDVQLANADSHFIPGDETGTNEAEDDSNDCCPNNACLYFWEFIFNVVAILTYLIDVGSDVSLAVRYYLGGHWYWFAMTILFVFLPSLLMTGCNIIWYFDVKSKRTVKQRQEAAENNGLTWVMRGTSIALHIAPVLRYVNASAGVVLLWRAKNKAEKQRLKRNVEKEEMDSGILRLFECFLEAIPQLCLQLFIIFSVSPLTENIDSQILTNAIVIMQYISMTTSLLSALWALCAYHRKLHKHRIGTTLAALLHITWHFLILSSRIMAIAISATYFKDWILILIGVHWFLMFLWIMICDTIWQNPTWKDVFFDVLASWAYIFYFFNLAVNQSPWKYLIYYSIVYLENAAMVIGWYHFTQGMNLWYNIHITVFVLAGFFIGVVCQALYYGYFHLDDTAVDILRSNFREENELETTDPSDITSQMSTNINESEMQIIKTSNM